MNPHRLDEVSRAALKASRDLTEFVFARSRGDIPGQLRNLDQIDDSLIAMRKGVRADQARA